MRSPRSRGALRRGLWCLGLLSLFMAPAAQAREGLSPPASCPAEAQTAALWRFEAADRVVAVGDVHGDLAALRATLRGAALIDAQDHWIGGRATLVQLGDLLDRGDDEAEVIDLLDRLATQARAAGGRVVQLLGNHEQMNVIGDLRYVTEAGWAAFGPVPTPLPKPTRAVPSGRAEESRARLSCMRPGAPCAQRFARWPGVAVVGDTLFAHGGVRASHAEAGIGCFNHQLRTWLLGEAGPPVDWLGQEGPLWSRHWSGRVVLETACAELDDLFVSLGVRRMVVAHTPQREGINAVCGERVWRIDVGMAAHYGGHAEALEIRGATLRRLRPEP